jgi:hypothetical protein
VKHIALPRFAAFEVFSERILRTTELWAVVMMLIVVSTTMVCVIVWVLFSPAERLLSVLKNVNENWKACLLVLLPLFYPTIRGILQRIKRFPLGMEPQEPEEQSKSPMPPKTVQAPTLGDPGS